MVLWDVRIVRYLASYAHNAVKISVNSVMTHTSLCRITEAAVNVLRIVLLVYQQRTTAYHVSHRTRASL